MASEPAVIDLTGSSPSPSHHASRSSQPPPSIQAMKRPSNFQSRSGAKRLVIKNLRQIPRLNPSEYFERTWLKLSEGLDAIFAGQPAPHSIEELYRGVENICRQEMAELLYTRMSAQLQRLLQTQVHQPLRARVAGPKDNRSRPTNVELLDLMLAVWSDWNAKMAQLRVIFFYLDRSFLLQSRTHPTINELGQSSFCKTIFQDETLQDPVVQGIIELYGEERKFHGAARQSSLLKASIKMIHDLQLYGKVFERRFLDDSKKFFDALASDLAAKEDLASYVRTCDAVRTAELARCGFFDLDTRTRRDIVNIMDRWLVSNKVELLIKPEDIGGLLDDNDVESLEKIYALLERVGKHNQLRGAWEKYIRTNGAAIVSDEGRESEMVVRLLELKTRLDQVWRTSFHKHEELGHVLRESFASFINEKKKGSRGGSNSKPGEMIAKYVDMLLRGGIKAVPSAAAPSTGSKRLPSALISIGSGKEFGAEGEDIVMEDGDDEVQLNQQLDQVLDLFRFIEGKDVFEAFYKKDLARRLLMNRSASADAERTMLARLKTECGAGFTHNLEQMFKDVDLARDEMTSYKIGRAERGITKRTLVDLNVNVLSAAAWPTYPDIPVTIPPEIARAVDDYDTYYKQKHTGRRLTWKHELAHCVVRAVFPKGNKELGVSSFQAVVLLLFNDVADGKTLTYAQIQSATGLSDVELTRTLQSLACARHRVLRKSPHGRDINPEIDRFSYHASFSSPLTRIKINQIQLRETPAENLATHEDVHRDRQYETQAAVVRIMKSLGDGGEITFAELQAETIKATRKRGALAASEIKGQVEKLIEKEYIERSAGGKFRYLA